LTFNALKFNGIPTLDGDYPGVLVEEYYEENCHIERQIPDTPGKELKV
jgi:hypothetical protein